MARLQQQASSTPLLLILLVTLLALSSAPTLTLASPTTSKTTNQHTVALIHPRQAASATPDTRCTSYLQTARLATVGGNSTYRTAYLQLSRQGTNANRVLLNAAVAALPALTVDKGLNAQCGNLTERVAAQTEEEFFGAGVVLGIGGVGGLDSPPGKIVGSDWTLVLIVAAMLGVMMGTWSML
ncbi:hypothetical protein EJ05DRAFT_475523 [Pseudovirgaria hyperparasitica]|uniref:Uncharacterized protein n=1 Tax=Pseudovirgaria hyperparasitica TaxID=470096 RepID=A0A6A6W9F6_9PEZI|nr:uncharacterized protein EJ05DRAFT_475523 [Pseudovirgaria hyperparasitica]KAF2759303.1 hypothetical protein EJ05DRAFT_475523 [Pseudovirgaria hyperparasitica]